MKRCKACTTRAAGAVECALLAEHEGAHEGETLENGARVRAVWNDPNAPYFEALEPEQPPPASALPPAPPLPELEELPPEYVLQIAPVAPPAAAAQRTIVSHCACGTEHSDADPSVRPGPGLPLMAVDRCGEIDDRFAWARVCVGCGAVYCRLWRPAVDACTCQLSWIAMQREQWPALPPVHVASCPKFRP